MKAIVYENYGSTKNLKLKEVQTPTPKDNEVLIKIHAASLNATELDYLRGMFLIRLESFFKPKHKILGSDIAGVIEAIGKDVKEFKVGDEVFCDSYEYGFGAFAEYKCMPEKAVHHKPKNMTFEQVSTLPQAAVLALQALFGEKKIQPGDKILINGAGGGVGTFAIQIAKSLGAEVTGVDSEEKLQMMKNLGADFVIDYKKEDFTKNGKQYDLVINTVAYRSVYRYMKSLTPNGSYIVIGGSIFAIIQTAIIGAMKSKNSDKKVGLLMWKSNRKEDFEKLSELFNSGKFTPIIHKVYSVEEVPEALRELKEGRVIGKSVIRLS